MAPIDPEEPCPCGSGKLYKDCHAKLAKRTTPEISEHERLTVIPEPDPGTRTVLERSGEDPLILLGAESGVSYDCGSCGASLLAGIRMEQIVNIVFRCAVCGSYNDSLVQ